MKTWIAVAVLALSLTSAAQGQITGDWTGRSHSKGDTNDSGVLPLMMATPYGPAFLLVHESGWAMLSIPSIGVSFHGLLGAMPLLPGMHDATVGGGMCELTITQDADGTYVSQWHPIHGNGSTLTNAVSDYKANVKAAGDNAMPCQQGQG